jgi:hypothetical protein
MLLVYVYVYGSELDETSLLRATLDHNCALLIRLGILRALRRAPLFIGSLLMAAHRRPAGGAPGFVGGAPVKPIIDRPPWKIGILPLRSGIDPQFIGSRKSRRLPRLRERRGPNAVAGTQEDPKRPDAVADTQEDPKRLRKSEGDTPR